MKTVIKILIILTSLLMGATSLAIGWISYTDEYRPVAYALFVVGVAFLVIGICAGFYFSIEESLEEFNKNHTVI